MTTKITKDRLKQFIGLSTPVPWDTVYVEIVYGNTGTARAHIRGEATPFYAGGYGYDKTSVVLADFINYYVDKKVCSTAGSGVDVVKDQALTVDVLVNCLSETKDGYIYEIKHLTK